MEELKTLGELQKQFDTASYNLNKSLVRLLIASENDASIPPAEFDRALEACKAVRVTLNAIEPWIVDHSE